MNFQDKTKDELIVALQELQSQHASVLELYNLNIAKHEHSDSQNQLFLTIFDNTTEAVFAKDISGKYKFINEAGACILGFKVADIIDHSDFELIPHDTAIEFQKTDFHVMSTGKVYEREETGLIQGKRCLFLAHKIPWFDDAGNIIGVIGISKDITERVQAEETLNEKVNMIANMSSQLPGMIYLFERKPDGTFVVPYSSIGIKDIFGCSPEDVKTSFDPVFKTIYPEDRDNMIRVIEASAKELSPFELEYRVQLPGKPIQWIFAKSIAERLVDGTIRWYGFNTDITQQKYAEHLLHEKIEEIESQNKEYLQLNEELIQTNDELQLAKEKVEDSKQKYKQLIENLHVGIVVHAPDTSIVLINNEAAELLGCKQVPEDGKELFDPYSYFCDENGQRLRPEEYPVAKVLANQSRLVNKVFCIDAQGNQNKVWVDVNAYPEFNVFHQLQDVVVTFINITERKANENALMKTKVLLSEMGHVAKIGGWEFDPITLKGMWTDEVAVLHDLPVGSEPNVTMGISYYVNNSRDKIEKAIKNAIEYGTAYDLELEINTAKGIQKWIRTTGQVEKKDNQIIRVFGSMQDITERVLVKQELIRAKEKAEESDRLKTAFLQNMSHEIRTPLNAIMGFSSLLFDNCDKKEKLEKFSDIINQSCIDLLDIINDILDISKIESGQLPINMEECNVDVLFSELQSFFSEQQKRLNKQHIQFSMQPFGNASNILIISDKIKLKQIFINLISNAFKFTDNGSIEGGCRFDANQNLLFYVSDTGIGIPFDKQNIVFERFSQLNQSLNKATGGTGLGLSIVKGLVNLLGGEVFLESEPGKGSTFKFTIPYKTNQPMVSENTLTSMSNTGHE